MPVERLLPSQEAHDLIELTRDVADKVLRPKVDAHEKSETFPDGVFPALGRAGLLSLPYPEEFGGGGQPYEVYLQVLEELAARWAAVAVAPASTACPASRSPLTAPPNSASGCRTCWAATPSAATASRSRRPAPTRPHSPARPPRRRRVPDQRLEGVDHQRRSRRLLHALRPHQRRGPRGISCFLVDSATRGPELRQPEEKMGLRAVPTTTAHYDDAVVDAERRIGRRPGPADRVQRARLGPARHRRRRGRARPGRARRRSRIRQGAQGIRQAHHRPSGPRLPARRHGGRRGLGPRHLPRRRPTTRRRAAVQPPGELSPS